MTARRGNAAAGTAAWGGTGLQQRPAKSNAIHRANQEARPYRVIAIKNDGRRTVIGSFPSRAAAERWAEMLRGFASWASGDAVVEHVRRQR